MSKFRPPPIKTFKESDSLTALAMRREYLLYLHDFPSSFEEAGVTSVTSYMYSNNGRVTRAGAKTTISVHLFSMSSQNGCVRLKAAAEGIKNPPNPEFFMEPLKTEKGKRRNQGIPMQYWPSFAQLQGSSSVYYFTHDSGRVESGDTAIKAWPPIRRLEHRLSLWNNLESGVLNMVTSGHTPMDPALKFSRDGDFYRAAVGVNSIEMMLPAMWTTATKRNKEAGEERDEAVLLLLAESMCVAPAKFLGVANRKGGLAPGMEADICVWDPDAFFVVNNDGHCLQSKFSASIYDGEEMRGVVQQTYLRGERVFDRNREGSMFLEELKGRVVMGEGTGGGV